MFRLFLFYFMVSGIEAYPYCKYHRANTIEIDCDVSKLRSGRLEWRAFDSHTNTSLTIYRCTNGDDCGIGVPFLNGSVGFDSVSESMTVTSSGMEIPEIAQYYNVYSQFQCWGGDNLTLVCDTPDMLAAVINPTCSTPVISDNVNISVLCRAATFFKPNDYNFTIITNKRNRNTTTTATYYEHYSAIEMQDVRYYDVNFTLETDLSRLGSGYHKFRVAVNHKNFRSSIASTVLNVTSKLNTPNCDTPRLSNDSMRLDVKCRTDLVYPQLLCDFNTWTNKTLRNVSGEVSYSTSLDLSSSPIGYMSECQLHINLSQLGPGAHEFQVVMYTNSSSNTTVTGQVTSPLLLALPTVRLSDECVQEANSLYGKVWSNITCLCLLDSPGIPTGSQVWSVNNVVRSEATVTAFFNDFVNKVKYVCIPESPLQPNISGVELIVGVPRPPSIASFTANSSSEDTATNLNASVSFRCDADGIPSPTTLFGKHPGQETVINSSIPVPIHFNSCLNTGQYCCTVENSTSYKVESKCLSVFVRCPQVSINQTHINITVHHGADVSLTIAVYGYPAPSQYTLNSREHNLQDTVSPTRYRVTYTNVSPPYGSIRLSMPNIQAGDFGDYTLAFSNGIGDIQNYSFSVINGTPHISSFTANSSSTNITIDMNNTVTFRCDVEGLNVPEVYFVNKSGHNMRIQGSLPFSIPFTDCLDTGAYCCKIKNKTLYQVDNECLSVFVRCPQTLENKTRTSIIAHQGDTVNLTISVYGYPAPNEFILIKTADNGRDVISPSRYVVTYTELVMPYGSIVLEMPTRQADDFANYTLAIGNGVGDKQNAYFSVIKEKSNDSGSGSKMRDIAIGVSCGVVAVICAIVVLIVLVKKGLCKRKDVSNDAELNKFSEKS